MVAESPLLIEIDARLRTLYAELGDGGNSSPGYRFQLEGLLQAAVILNIATVPGLWQLLDRVYTELYGHSAESVCGSAWEDPGGFPALPVRGQRAPVYPTTKD